MSLRRVALKLVDLEGISSGHPKVQDPLKKLSKTTKTQRTGLEIFKQKNLANCEALTKQILNQRNEFRKRFTYKKHALQ